MGAYFITFFQVPGLLRARPSKKSPGLTWSSARSTALGCWAKTRMLAETDATL